MSSRRESVKVLEGQYQPQNQSIANYLKSFNEMTEFSRTQEIHSAQFGNNERKKIRKQISISRSTPAPCELNKIPIPKFFYKRNSLDKQELIQEPPKQITIIRRTLINPAKQKQLNDTALEATKLFIDSRKEYFIKRTNQFDQTSPKNQNLRFKNIFSSKEISQNNGGKKQNQIVFSTNRSYSQESDQNKNENLQDKCDSPITSTARNSKTPQPRKRQSNILINDLRLKLAASSSPISQVSRKYISPIFSLSNRTSYDFPKSLQQLSSLKGRSLSNHTKTGNNLEQTDLEAIEKRRKPIFENRLQTPCSSNDELPTSELSPKEFPRSNVKPSCQIKLQQNQDSILSEAELNKQPVKKFKLLSNPIIGKLQKKENEFSEAIEDPYQVKDRLNQQFEMMSAKNDSQKNLANQIKQSRSRIQTHHITIFDSQKYLNARYNSGLYISTSITKEINNIVDIFEQNLKNQLNQI